MRRVHRRVGGAPPRGALAAQAPGECGVACDAEHAAALLPPFSGGRGWVFAPSLWTEVREHLLLPPLPGEGWGGGTARSDTSSKVSSRVSPRRASHFLCFAKESNPRKATPVAVTPAAPGRPALRGKTGEVRKLACGSNMRPSDPRFSSHRRHIHRGGERRAIAALGPGQIQKQGPARRRSRCQRSASAFTPPRTRPQAVLIPKPLCMRLRRAVLAGSGPRMFEVL